MCAGGARGSSHQQGSAVHDGLGYQARRVVGLGDIPVVRPKMSSLGTSAASCSVKVSLPYSDILVEHHSLLTYVCLFRFQILQQQLTDPLILC